MRRFIGHFSGPFVLRFVISGEGGVCGLRVILDRVFTAQEPEEDWSSLANKLTDMLGSAMFPASTGETGVTLPLRFDGR